MSKGYFLLKPYCVPHIKTPLISRLTLPAALLNATSPVDSAPFETKTYRNTGEMIEELYVYREEE